MYLDVVENDPNKNRRRGLIIFIICVLYLGVIVKCAGQTCMQRVRPFYNSDTTRFVACTAINFGVLSTDDKEDTIQMGILMDSLDNSYSPVIFVWYPKSSNSVLSTAEIDFGFNKIGIKTLKFTFIDRNIKYAEYRLTKEQSELFKNNIYEYISFRINGQELTYAEDWVENPLISDFLKSF